MNINGFLPLWRQGLLEVFFSPGTYVVLAISNRHVSPFPTTLDFEDPTDADALSTSLYNVLKPNSTGLTNDDFGLRYRIRVF